ncbi:hypothetical protein B0T17DRAFT_511936 [Bombardia bombarda]|uniref:Uncharacterized protein n=1 Tax=Bombardia bombarda TaxID=252184 RepID=A0AA39TGU4_9PEZI|nr:hypothetical protein B0T17DRAFT_511936 [Bombardia bombarda]
MHLLSRLAPLALALTDLANEYVCNQASLPPGHPALPSEGKAVERGKRGIVESLLYAQHLPELGGTACSPAWPCYTDRQGLLPLLFALSIGCIKVKAQGGGPSMVLSVEKEGVAGIWPMPWDFDRRKACRANSRAWQIGVGRQMAERPTIICKTLYTAGVRPNISHITSQHIVFVQPTISGGYRSEGQRAYTRKAHPRDTPLYLVHKSEQAVGLSTYLPYIPLRARLVTPRATPVVCAPPDGSRTHPQGCCVLLRAACCLLRAALLGALLAAISCQQPGVAHYYYSYYYIALMLPFLEVAHLPSSSSFYSAIVQPLSLQYLTTEDGAFPSITFGTYGRSSSRATPVFQIRQVTASSERPLRISRIALAAPSADAANDAFAFAVRANPDIQEAYLRHPSETHTRSAASGASASRSVGGGGETRVDITDFDGNNMAIIYRPPAEYPSHYSGSTLRRTQSTDEEASRILHWNYDVMPSAASSASSAFGAFSRGASTRTATRRPYVEPHNDDDQPYPSRLRRSVTTSSSVYEPTATPRQNSNGLSASAVVGTLLGVAAGAAMAYGATRYDRSRAPRQDYDDQPTFTRRSTFPDPYPDQRKGRFVEVERAVEKVRYPEAYPPVSDHRPPPEYIARYIQVSVPRSREMDDLYDDPRGRHPSPRSRTASVRTRSENATNRQPLLGDPGHRSYTNARSSHHPPIVQRSYTYDTPERESYVSARSHRSSATARPSPVPVSSHTVSRSRAGSWVTTTTIKVGGDVPSPRALSRSGTYMSARHVPLPPSEYSARHITLPPSGAGTSYAGWAEEEADDDVDSIAPSDSISCVGSRRSGRSHH